MKILWKSITVWGTNDRQIPVLRRNIVLTNNLALILLLLSLVLALLILAYFGPVISALMAVGAALLQLSVLLINRFGYPDIGRLLLTMGMPVYTLISALVSKSPDNFVEEFEYFDTRLIILSTVVLPMIIFDLREKKRLGIALLITLLCLILYDPVHNLFGYGYFQMGLSSGNYPFINYISVLVWALVTGSMYSLKYQLLKYERALQEKNTGLASKNTELAGLYSEIEAQNEEIIAQTEEIIEKRDQMQQAHAIIMM
ncbi:MAG: hypothetical protein WBB45_06950 [Cyclobacteriaceae bacterium]